jgi:hypothetical protein
MNWHDVSRQAVIKILIRQVLDQHYLAIAHHQTAKTAVGPRFTGQDETANSTMRRYKAWAAQAEYQPFACILGLFAIAFKNETPRYTVFVYTDQV